MTLQASVIVMLVSTILSSAQIAQSPTSDQAALMASVQEIAVAAVTFHEGDAAGFNRARSHFSPDGWKDFVKHMDGFLDQGGAPTFTSSFVVLHDARFLGEKDGVLFLRIPGTLVQSSKLGRTTYRAALEVHAIRDGDSRARLVKIQRLEQITCAGQSTACQ